MKLTHHDLIEMVEEELDNYISEVNRKKKKKKSQSQRKRELPWETFPGYDDRNGGLKQLANGIVELDDLGDDGDPDDELEEDCLGNPYRNAQGHFSSKADHAVITTGYEGDNTSKDCKHGKWKRNRQFTSHKCGRHPSGKKHPKVCKTGKLREAPIKVRGDVAYISIPYLLAWLEEQASTDGLETVLEGADQSDIVATCKQYGLISRQEAFQDIVKSINTVQLAQKGDLFKPNKA